MTNLPFDTEEPLAVNEKGVKFWRDTESQDASVSMGLDLDCFFLEHPDGERVRAVFHEGGLWRASASFEDIYVFLEMEKFSRDVQDELSTGTGVGGT